MKIKLVMCVVTSLLFSSSLIANDNLVFKKTDNSRETNLCYKLATANEKQVKHLVRHSFSSRTQQRMALKGLKCNDMTAFNWADKYASPDVKNYVGKYNKNKNKGSVTITDIN